jgi:phosphoenolpyruvate carboxylase
MSGRCAALSRRRRRNHRQLLDALLGANPLLKQSICIGFPLRDALIHVQVEMLRRYRAEDQDERRISPPLLRRTRRDRASTAIPP